MKNNSFRNIVISTSGYSNNSKNINSVVLKLEEILIVFIGIVSTAFLFVTTFKIKCSNVFIIAISILFSLILTYIFNETTKMKYKILGLLFSLIITIYFFRADIFQGFLSVLKRVSEVIDIDMDNRFIHKYINNFVYKDYYAKLFLVLMLFIKSIFIKLIVKYSPNVVLMSLVTLPEIIVAINFDVFPSNSTLILIIAFLVSIYSMQVIKKSKKNKDLIIEEKSEIIKNRVSIVLLIIILIISISIIYIYPESKYRRLKVLDEFRSNIEYFISDVSFDNIFSSKASGGVSGGQLGKVDSLVYDNKVDLEVTLPENLLYYKNINTYLRGFIGGDYTGSSFKPIDNKIYSKYSKTFKGTIPQNISYESLDLYNDINYRSSNIYKAEIKIKNVEANDDYVYAPYNTYYNGDNFEFYQDEYIIPNNISEYEFSYFITDPRELFNKINDGINNFQNNKYNELLYYKNNYKDYVYSVYTEVPKDKFKELKDEYNQYYKQNNYDIEDCISKVKERVVDGTKYDLSPGALPAGEDFVEYFLYKNKKGYCSHFASAATIIFRIMGIPARYVEGYLLNTSECSKDRFIGYKYIGQNASLTNLNNMEAIYSKIYVKDSNAHAWVEIYIDSLGWVPIEVTPNSNYDDTDSESLYSSVDEDILNEEVRDTSNIIDIQNVEGENYFKYLIIIVSILIIVSIPIRRLIILSIRRRNFNSVSYIYKYILAVFNFLGFNELDSQSYREYAKYIESRNKFINKDEFIKVTDIFLKYKYSEFKISKEEMNVMMIFAKEISKSIYNQLPNIRKIKFKYLNILI